MTYQKLCSICGKPFETTKQTISKCEICRQPVYRPMKVCPICNSSSIHRRHLIFKKVKYPDKPTARVRIPRYACYACRAEFETPAVRETATNRLPSIVIHKKKEEAKQAS